MPATPRPIPRAPSFLLGAHTLAQLPPDEGVEIAFAGRSNAGKSTALNGIFARRDLARTSRTPGRTQQMNCYDWGEGRRIVDLPGYGHAEVPKPLREHWARLLPRYLAERRSLTGVFLLSDCRHPLQPSDVDMLRWIGGGGRRVHLLLTKADKLSRGAALATLASVQAALGQLPVEASVQLLSVPARTGLDEAREQLTRWLADGMEPVDDLRNEAAGPPFGDPAAGPPEGEGERARPSERPPRSSARAGKFAGLDADQ